MICKLIRIQKNQQLLEANTQYEEDINRLTRENTDLQNIKHKLVKENKILEEENWKYKQKESVQDYQMNDDQVEALRDELDQERTRNGLYMNKIKQLVDEKNEITNDYNRLMEELEDIKQQGDSKATKSHLTGEGEEMKKMIQKKDIQIEKLTESNNKLKEKLGLKKDNNQLNQFCSFDLRKRKHEKPQ